MPAAPPPFDESDRLEALRRTAMLDTGIEEFFEDLADSLQQSVHAPIVLVSLVDERRQWFKARRGLNATETTRDQAFCAHAILGNATLRVADARCDARFRDNPLVTSEPRIIAYAGAPLVLECGARLGTVCVVDNEPRQWSNAEISHLERHARLAARHIDARRAHLERDRHRFLELALARAELRYESVIQSASEGMVVLGPSGAIIDSNKAASEILGLSEDELYGRTPRDPRWRAVRANGQAFPGDNLPVVVTLRTGEPQRDVVIGVQTPTGEQRWLNINSYPVRATSGGRVDQVVAVFRVVQLEQARA